jgi:hypothetical protein
MAGILSGGKKKKCLFHVGPAGALDARCAKGCW